MRHYLDHASTSPMRPEVRDAMVGWINHPAGASFDAAATGGLSGRQETAAGDPSRIHAEGRAARTALEEAREQIATFLHTRPRQVILTSCGTESVNSAAWAAARAYPGQPHLLAGTEHSSAREASRRLAPLVELPVDRIGRIDVAQAVAIFDDLLARGTPPGLVHCQMANHEVGTIQPVAQVVDACRQRGIWVHVDACAACGHMSLEMDKLGADLMSVTAHKAGGPPGSGALVVRRGLRVEPLIVGGDQERARRAGFENVTAAIGFAAVALLLSDEAIAKEARTARRLTNDLIAAAMAVPGVQLLGDPEHRLPNLACFTIEGVEAEPVLLGLDRSGIAAHSGSSCSSESLQPSPVLTAMGIDAERSLRLSVGWSTTPDDISAFAEAFPTVVSELRALRA